MATSKLGDIAKVAISLVIVLFFLPNLSARYWVAPLQVPPFFSSRTYANYLSRGETVVILPYSSRGDSMLWQAQTGMYFRMAGGWTGPMPEGFAHWPIANAFMKATYVPDARNQLMAFLVNHDVSAVIVSDGDPYGPTWRSLLAASGIVPIRTGGVSLYRVPGAIAARYNGVTALEAAVQANRMIFGGLAAAAQKYLADGGNRETLNPGEATKLGLLPSTWLVGPPRLWLGGFPAANDDSEAHFRGGALLGASPNGSVIVGLAGYYDSLKPLIETYRNDALHIYFPYRRSSRLTPRTMTGESWSRCSIGPAWTARSKGPPTNHPLTDKGVTNVSERGAGRGALAAVYDASASKCQGWRVLKP